MGKGMGLTTATPAATASSAVPGGGGLDDASTSGRGPRRAVERAWASLLPHADAIADDITLTLLDKDWHGEAGPELRADIRSSVREHVHRGIRTMAGL
ncbi:hypothetical protein, partial [Streptomyces sp. UH6]|uniref:hypothetical protein n=1 Tax=Streptomyces sp. UH6 TaxID=2748379 RepID=UPI0017CC3E8B